MKKVVLSCRAAEEFLRQPGLSYASKEIQADPKARDELAKRLETQTVYLVHRRRQFNAQRIAQERALGNPRIDVLWNTVVTAIVGEQGVRAVRVKSIDGGAERELAAKIRRRHGRHHHGAETRGGDQGSEVAVTSGERRS